jgi:site-specific DNA recombinase
MQKTGAIYARVSTEDQYDNGNSIPTQIEALLNRATERGVLIPEDYVFSEDFSGYYLERPKLYEVRKLAREGKIDVLLVYDLDRLSRKQTHQVVLLHEFEESSEIEVEFFIQEFDRSADGQFLRHAIGFMAEKEREKILERTMRGKRARAKRGLIMGTGIPKYGYAFGDKERGTYAIDEDAAKVVRYIFQLCIEGKTGRQIADILNAEGYPSRGAYLRSKGFESKRKVAAIWDAFQVARVIKDPIYKGEFYAFGHKSVVKKIKNQVTGQVKVTRLVYRNKGDDRIPLPCEAIVDANTWESAQEALKLHSTHRVTKGLMEGVGLLRSGFAICGKCQKMLYVQTQVPVPSQSIQRSFYYRCSSFKDRDSTCPNKGGSIRVHMLDNDVWKDITTFIGNSAGFLDFYQEVLATQDSLKTQEHYDLESARAALAKEQENMSSLLLSIQNSRDKNLTIQLTGLAEACSQRIQQHEAEIAELEVLVNRHDNARAQVESALALVEMGESKLECASFEERRMILQILGARIRVFSSGDLQENGKRYTISLKSGDLEKDVPSRPSS